MPWKPFKEVTRDARILSGLFTAYLKRENVYLALKPEQLDRDFLMVTQLSQGVGDFFVDGGSSIRSDLIRFRRSGDRVQLWVVNPYLTATPNTPIAQTVAYSFGHSIAYSFPIASVRDTTNEVLVDLAYPGMEPRVRGGGGGVKNAIQVLDAPDDTLWSAEDARYSTVRWLATHGYTYAIGPSDVDPRTGEILNADILIAAS